ncbi:MAG: DNA-processing protein DprA [Anaerolineales bacterium]
MQAYWLAFTQVKGLGPVRLRHVRAQFDTIQAAWEADDATLAHIGIPASVLQHRRLLQRQLAPAQLLEAVHGLGAHVITLDDAAYPPLLKELPDAPVVLYVKGELTPEDGQAVALVGTRKASSYGKLVAQNLAAELATQRLTVVSGLAHGIDAVAHRAALDAGGRTLAVLGTGIDTVYPSEHRHLAADIIRQGALVTEFAPGTRPERGNFPIRNRIISGLCLGTVVVEAPARSGSLQTANLAAEQGREVFAVPGNINHPNSEGANRLIQDGARLVLTADDILSEIDIARRHTQARQTIRHVEPDSALEAQIMAFLAAEARHVDEICRACEHSVQAVNVALTMMEIKGLVYQTAPMTYHVAQPYNGSA